MVRQAENLFWHAKPSIGNYLTTKTIFCFPNGANPETEARLD